MGTRNILELETSQNMGDVELFLRREMKGRVAPPGAFEAGVKLVLEKSGGLLLYVHYVREERFAANKQGDGKHAKDGAATPLRGRGEEPREDTTLGVLGNTIE